MSAIAFLISEIVLALETVSVVGAQFPGAGNELPSCLAVCCPDFQGPGLGFQSHDTSKAHFKAEGVEVPDTAWTHLAALCGVAAEVYLRIFPGPYLISGTLP